MRALAPQVSIAVIPNGVALPQASKAASPAAPPWAGVIPSGESFLLFLSRSHRKKALEALLSAWQTLVGYGDEGALAPRVGPPCHLTCGSPGRKSPVVCVRAFPSILHGVCAIQVGCRVYLQSLCPLLLEALVLW